jgi:hypothetical protein
MPVAAEREDWTVIPAIWVEFLKVGFAMDSPVEGAVRSELVSEAKFPASRENELRVFASLADAKAQLD